MTVSEDQQSCKWFPRNLSQWTSSLMPLYEHRSAMSICDTQPLLQNLKKNPPHFPGVAWQTPSSCSAGIPWDVSWPDSRELVGWTVWSECSCSQQEKCFCGYYYMQWIAQWKLCWNGCSCLGETHGMFSNILHNAGAGSTPLMEILKVTLMQQAIINS